MSNIVFEYFEKEEKDIKILVQLNPMSYSGRELLVYTENGETFIKHRKIKFDKDIYEDFEADGFKKGNPLEFNLYLSKI